MSRPIKHDAMKNDSRLLEMAFYQASHGQTQNSSQDKIIKILREFKSIIKRGEATIDSLEDTVFSRFGIVDERSYHDTEMVDSGMFDQADAGRGFFRAIQRKSSGLGEEGKEDNPPPDLDEEFYKEMDRRVAEEDFHIEEDDDEDSDLERYQDGE
jgi:hypothetical protein